MATALWKLIAWNVVTSMMIVIGCASLPVLGGLGPESAQVFSVCAVLVCGSSGVWLGLKRRETGYLGDIAILFKHALLPFLGIGIVGLSIVGWLWPSCLPQRGLSWFLIMTLPVCLLHLFIGLWCGRVLHFRKTAWFLWLGIIALWVLWTVYTWCLDPSFRLITHGFVLIHSDMTHGLVMNAELAWFRVATGLIAISIGMFGVAVFLPQRRESIRYALYTPSLYALAFCMAMFALWIHNAVSTIVNPDTEKKIETFSIYQEFDGIHVRASPESINPYQAQAILAEALLWRDRLQKRLQLDHIKPVTIWLYASSEERAYWTGAEHVDFAFPWRGELHVVYEKNPHTSLGHELAHLMAAQVADPTLPRTLPRWNDLVFSPTMIEGVAMALTAEIVADNGFTLREQAAALMQNSIAAVENIHSDAQFLTQASSVTYRLAGALVEWAIAENKQPPGKTIAILLQQGLNGLYPSSYEKQAFLERFKSYALRLELPAGAAGFAQQYVKETSPLRATCENQEHTLLKHAQEAIVIGDKERLQKNIAALDITPSWKLVNALAQKGKSARQWETVEYLALLAEAQPNERSQSLAKILRADAVWMQKRDAQAAKAILESIHNASDLTPEWSRSLWIRWQLANALTDPEFAIAGLLGLDSEPRQKQELITHVWDFLASAESSRNVSRARLLNDAFYIYEFYKRELLEQNDIRSSISLPCVTALKQYSVPWIAAMYVVARAMDNAGVRSNAWFFYKTLLTTTTSELPSQIIDQMMLGKIRNSDATSQQGGLYHGVGLPGLSLEEEVQRSQQWLEKAPQGIRVQYFDLMERIQKIEEKHFQGDVCLLGCDGEQ